MHLDNKQDRSFHFDELSTEELETLLCDDLNDHTLSIDDILDICQILARRKAAKPDVDFAWERFQTYYLWNAK